MDIIKSIVVPPLVENIRFIDYLLKYFPCDFSRNRIKKAIKSGEFLLDGETVESGRYLKTGQCIELIKPEKKQPQIYKKNLPIIFEDDYLAIINKPAGLSVSGNYFRTVQNALPFNLKSSGLADALLLPRPVHRLDNQTSGLLVVAKTHKAAVNLSKQFEEKVVQKSYMAIVVGKTEIKGTINTPIDNKEALTEYNLIDVVPSKRFEYLSLLKLTPLTGRTHQLRIHLASIGHPILGDKIYTPDDLLFKGKGLFLSAVEIKLQHPDSGELLRFTIEIPHKFMALIERWKK